MSQRQIKSITDAKPKRIRGHRQHRNVEAYHKEQALRAMREQVRRRRLTKVDSTTGETYVLARLVLRGSESAAVYKGGLEAAIAAAPETVEGQTEEIRGHLQACIDNGLLMAIPCGKGDKPVCRVYSGQNKRVVAIRQDDPDLK